METLPALWYIKSNNLEACKFFDKQRGERCYLKSNGETSFLVGYLCSNNDKGHSILGTPGHRNASYHCFNKQEGYTELTKENFRRLVLQEQSEPVINNHYSII